MRYFEILIVSVVTICYQCLQTVSAVGGPPSPGALWAIAPSSAAIVTRRRLFADAPARLWLQNRRMSKIKNGGLDQYGAGCFEV